MSERQREARFRRRAIKVDEAIRLILEAAEPGRKESVPIWEAGGRRLSEAVFATTDWPPFARAGMDGFAVRSVDTALASPTVPAMLRVAGSVAAGTLSSVEVTPGTAIRIMTGGAVPQGADAVVMLEQTADATVDGQPAVQVKSAAWPGQNLAPQGEEFRCGSVIAEPGELLRPGHVALLGTFGYADVPIYARPRVAVLATGAELLPVEAPLAPGRIRDSNSVMIAALVAQCGGLPVMYGSVPDEPRAAAQTIEHALMQCDILITTGGVSVGDYDVMASLLRFIRTEEPNEHPREINSIPFQAPDATVEQSTEPAHSKEEEPHANSRQLAGSELLLPMNSRLLFNKVAMRPGSPTSAAVVSGKLLIALSGNPGACFVGFELFARAALLRMQGASKEQAKPKQVTAKLVGSFDKGSPHERFVRARLYTEQGILYANPLAFGKSSMMASLPAADGLVRIKASPHGAAEGTIVEVILI